MFMFIVGVKTNCLFYCYTGGRAKYYAVVGRFYVFALAGSI